MKTINTMISSAQARASFAEIINKAAYGKESTFITKNGKEVAAVVPAEMLRQLKKLQEFYLLSSAREAEKEAEEKGWVSLEEIEKLFSKDAE